MRDFLKEFKEKILTYDGSKGFLLQQQGLKGGECPELWNITNSEKVKNIYQQYKDSGSDVIQTNTFQGNRHVLKEYGLGDRTYELNFEAAKLAKEVMGNDGFIAASIGPLGVLMKPYGELDFETAFENFAEQIKALVDAGVDIIHFETFTDVAEMRAAILAAKSICHLPIISTLAFETNGKTLMGTDPFTAAIIMKSLGADIVGANCSFGPEGLIYIIEEMYRAVGTQLCVKPNAGLPEIIDGNVSYSVEAEKFCSYTEQFTKNGVRLLGGCCGTTPTHIAELKSNLKNIENPTYEPGNISIITSATSYVELDKTLKNTIIFEISDIDSITKAFKNNDDDYVIDLAMDLSEESDSAVVFRAPYNQYEEGLLAWIIEIAQGYLKLPFIFDVSNAEELGKVLKTYMGRAGVVIREDLPKHKEIKEIAMKYGSELINIK